MYLQLEKLEKEIGTGMGRMLVLRLKDLISNREEPSPKLYRTLHEMYLLIEAHYRSELSATLDILIVEIAGAFCGPRLLKILGSAELRYVSVKLFEVSERRDSKLIFELQDEGLDKPVRCISRKDSKLLSLYKGTNYVQAFKQLDWQKIPAYVFPYTIYMNDLMSLEHINLG